jgi:two-component system sensor histidine kinase YesM
VLSKLFKQSLNMSLKFKIITLFFTLLTIVSLILGYYSFQTSKKQIVNKVSSTNLGVVKEINNNMNTLQQTISDWVTVFTLTNVVQDILRSGSIGSNQVETMLYNGPTASIMNQMLVTGSFDYLSIYGEKNSALYEVSTDGSNGASSLNDFSTSNIYNKSLDLNGASYWFALTNENNLFIQYNRNSKIAMTRIIRDINNGHKIGFIFVGVNVDTIRNRYLKNLYDDNHGIAILDQDGTPLLTAGKSFYDQSNEAFHFLLPLNAGSSGSTIIKSNKEDVLISYSVNDNGLRTLYSIPMSLLTNELNSIKSFVILLIAICLVLCVPLLMVLTSFLTAPLKNLLLSMRKFQNGQFDESVEIKYWDEIGHLSKGYNNMVSNMKTLVNDVYVLRLKEQEAELKALQSQINPHFLYNMLDTIFWEAEAAGQERISEMIINLSRLFRLSLNQGKSFTSVGKEKEFIALYLSLQQMRFKEKLTYEINIPDELDRFVILKLCLQPFIENAIIHGIEQKREGGFISITGELEDDNLIFCIMDNGGGMSEQTLKQITALPEENDVHTEQDVGGYAVHNVHARLRHYYKDQYQLKYESEIGQGTKVIIKIPITTEKSGGSIS